MLSWRIWSSRGWKRRRSQGRTPWTGFDETWSWHPRRGVNRSAYELDHKERSSPRAPPRQPAPTSAATILILFLFVSPSPRPKPPQMSPPPIRFLRARLVGRPGLFTIDVGGGRISTITSNPATDGAPGETVDLRGEHWIGPGLSDAHVHFSTWALAESRLDLSQARSAEQTREIVRKRAEVGGTGEVIVGANFRVVSAPPSPLTQSPWDSPTKPLFHRPGFLARHQQHDEGVSR